MSNGRHSPSFDWSGTSRPHQYRNSIGHPKILQDGHNDHPTPATPHLMGLPETCINCGLRHRDAADPVCFFITVRKSGREPLQLESTTDPGLRTRKIPKSPAARERLLQAIWERFQELKAENDRARRHLLSTEKISKGELKAKEPIPWLSWHAPTKHKGQTRNEDNFRNVWQRHVEEAIRSYRGADPMCLTSTLLDPLSMSRDSLVDDDDKENAPPEKSKTAGTPKSYYHRSIRISSGVMLPHGDAAGDEETISRRPDSGYASSIGKEEWRQGGEEA